MEKTAIKSITHRNLTGELFLKRDLLLFDKIVLDQNGYEKAKHLAEFLIKQKAVVNSTVEESQVNLDFNLRSIDYLCERGIIEIRKVATELGNTIFGNTNGANLLCEQFIQGLRISGDEENQLHELMQLNNLSSIPLGLSRVSDYISRLYSASQLRINNLNICPLLETHETYNLRKKANKNTVLSILLTKFPIPKDNVSFEQILEFRKDEDTQAKYYNLINWVNSIVKGKSEVSEMEDTFLYLYNEYSNQYKIHKLKYSYSTFEIIITGITGFIDNLCRIKLSDATKQIFNLFKEDVRLLEDEQKFPGREIAYVHKAHRNF